MKKIILFTAIILVGLNYAVSAQTITATVVQQPCNDDGVVAVNMSGMTPPYTINYSRYYNGNWATITTIHSNILASNDTLKIFQLGMQNGIGLFMTLI